jgi:hypothetical protein
MVDDLISRTNPPFYMHMLCIIVIYNDREPIPCLFHTLDFRLFLLGCNI